MAGVAVVTTAAVDVVVVTTTFIVAATKVDQLLAALIDAIHGPKYVCDDVLLVISGSGAVVGCCLQGGPHNRIATQQWIQKSAVGSLGWAFRSCSLCS